MKRKIISALMALIMVMSTIVAVPISAFAQTVSQIEIESIYDAPKLYESADDSVYIEGNKKLSSSYSYGGVTYESDLTQIEIGLRDTMVSRSDSYTFNLATTESYSSFLNFSVTRLSNLIYSLIKGACSDELSVSTKDGDYIMWQFGGCGLAGAYGGKDGNVYYYTFTLTPISYHASAADEVSVDNFLNNYFSSFNHYEMSDYQLIKKFHDDILSWCTYDYAALDDSKANEQAYSAYGVFCRGRAVCQGYALAFYRLCKEVGISVRFVYSDPDSGNHAWNIVSLGGSYYQVDCTWDDSEDKYSQDFFVKTYSEIGSYDSYYREHTYYDELLTTYFNNNYFNYLAKKQYDSTKSYLSDVVFSLSQTVYTYSAVANYPSVIGYLDSNSFTNYYVSSYSNNINAGTAEVIIKGSGAYDGQWVKRTFVINSADINTMSFSLSLNSLTYNGESQYPSVNSSLNYGTDYNVTYYDNVNIGTGYAVITGLNNYYSTKAVYFTINPAKTTDLKVSARTSSSLTLKWDAQAGADGYQIYQYKNKKWKKIKTVSSDKHSYKIEKLSASSNYDFKVRAYKGSTYGSFSSTLKTSTSPKKTKIKSKTTSSRSITVKWSKVSGSGYQIQYSTSPKFVDSKTKTINVKKSSTVSKKLTKLKSGKKYYIRVRSYKTRAISKSKTNKYYSAWSSKVSITCK